MPDAPPLVSGRDETMKKKIVIGIAVVIVAALAIGAGVAYAQEQERQRQIEEHGQAVHALYNGYKADLDALDASYSADTERSILFAAVDDADAFKKKVEADKDKFALHDGSLYKHGDLLSEADKYAEVFKGYVVASYRKQLDSLLIADVNAEGITKEALAENVAALQALADEVEADAKEHDVWESDEARASFTAKIAEAVEADNAKIAEIEEAERKAAEEAEAARAAQEQAAAQQAYNYNSGGYDSESNGYSSGYDNGGASNGSANYDGYWYRLDDGSVDLTGKDAYDELQKNKDEWEHLADPNYDWGVAAS